MSILWCRQPIIAAKFLPRTFLRSSLHLTGGCAQRLSNDEKKDAIVSYCSRSRWNSSVQNRDISLFLLSKITKNQLSSLILTVGRRNFSSGGGNSEGKGNGGEKKKKGGNNKDGGVVFPPSKHENIHKDVEDRSSSPNSTKDNEIKTEEKKTRATMVNDPSSTVPGAVSAPDGIQAAKTEESWAKWLTRIMSKGREKDATISSWRELYPLLQMCRPELPLIFFSFICLAISVGVSLSFPSIFGKIVDLASVGNTDKVVTHAVTLAALFVGGGVATFIRVGLMSYAGENISFRLRFSLFRAILGQNLSFFEKNSVGGMVSRLNNDTAVLSKAVTEHTPSLIRSFFEFFGGSAILISLSPPLALATLLFVPPLALSAAIYGRYVKVLGYGSVIVSRGELTVGELTSFLVYSMYVGGSFVNLSQLFGEVMRTIGATARIFDIINSPLSPSSSLFFSSPDPKDFGKKIIDPKLYFKDFNGSKSIIENAINNMTNNNNNNSNSSSISLYNNNTAASLALNYPPPPPLCHGAIRFSNVFFAYPSRPLSLVCNDLNLNIEAGTHVAIVGESGGGKSTFSLLLTRLFDADRGGVEIDGRDLKTMDPRWVRRHVGIVPQEPILFSASIEENVKYGKPNATREEVEEALQKANVLDFVRKLPQGLSTEVKNNFFLSVGQKQRIAIARILLMKPKIIILDEVTSSLDSISENKIAQVLASLTPSHTLIVIAHRLQTVRRASKIIVLESGTVKQEGTWEELARIEAGKFRQLLNAAGTSKDLTEEEKNQKTKGKEIEEEEEEEEPVAPKEEEEGGEEEGEAKEKKKDIF